MINRTFDASVIGGGIIGLSTAYFLLKRNKKVILIEKNEIGSGASGACDDMILLQSKNPGISLELALESLELYKSLISELTVDIEFENRGGMILIEDQQQLAVMDEFVEKQKKFGLKVEIIDKQQVHKKQPYVNDTVIASTYSETDAQVNPLKVMRGFLSKGSEMGLEIKKNTIIRRIDEKSDHWRITFNDGKYIETEKIVNAAGAWASEIGDIVGVQIPILPKKGQIAVTEQVPKIGDTNVWSAEYIVAKLKPELAKKENVLNQKYGIGFAFTQSSNGNYLIGSTREHAGFNKETNYDALKIMINQAMHFFPILKNVHIIRSFAGIRPASADGKPIIGEVEGKKGFYMAAGHEGDGIALAPITGKLIADLMDVKSIHYNIQELNLKRFRHERKVKVV